jgi:hypothetical protein
MLDMWNRTIAACAISLLALSGCATPGGSQSTFHDPNMDFSLIQSLAVMPFANLTSSGRAHQKVRDVFMTMLQATGALYVIPPGEVARGISRVQVDNPAVPTPEEVVTLVQNLGADVVITGTVLEYGQVRSASASANVISVSVQMMEGQTGRIVWSASSTKGGIGAGERLFGGGGEPMNVVTAKAVAELLHRLFEE